MARLHLRTVTKDCSVFTRTGPEAVIYDLSRPQATTITLPLRSQWTSGLHWHEDHVEYLQVIQGKAMVTLGRSTWVHTPAHGIIEVKRGMVHEWHRYAGASENEDLVVREWTDPADGQKEVFFRMLNSFLLEPEPQRLYRSLPISFLEIWLGRYVIPVQLFVVFAAYDNWPVMLGLHGRLGWAIAHLVQGFATAIGGFVLGLDPVYDEYVSQELQDRACMGKNGSSKKIR